MTPGRPRHGWKAWEPDEGSTAFGEEQRLAEDLAQRIKNKKLAKELFE